MDKPNSNFYISEDEAKEQIDQYMIQKYYKPVSVSNSIIPQLEKNQNEDARKAKELSQELRIILDQTEF